MPQRHRDTEERGNERQRNGYGTEATETTEDTEKRNGTETERRDTGTDREVLWQEPADAP